MFHIIARTNVVVIGIVRSGWILNLWVTLLLTGSEDERKIGFWCKKFWPKKLENNGAFANIGKNEGVGHLLGEIKSLLKTL